MLSREDKIKKFIESYEIEIPEEQVESEFYVLMQGLKHNLRYAQMAGGGFSNPFEEAKYVAEMADEIREEAKYNVKEELVMKELIKDERFSVTKEELEAYAEEMVKREKTTMEMVRKFFGEDLSMLERDVKTKKAQDWICSEYEGEQ